jgi:chemotaxis protein MotB
MPRDKKKKADAPAGAPAWMTTFADLMSLLMTFFVLLLSFSTIADPMKFDQAMMSLRQAFGFLPQNLAVVPINLQPQSKYKTPQSIDRLARRLRRKLQVMGREKDIALQLDEDGGLRINLPSQILFDSARAELKPAAFGIMDDIGALLAEVPNATIEVRGHTDSRPLTSGGRYRDNWELSFGRAKAVTERLAFAGGIDRNQMEIHALGPSQPVADNETPEGLAANRRVELYVRGELSSEELATIREQVETLSDTVTTSPASAP